MFVRVDSVIELLYLNIDWGGGGGWGYLAKDKHPNYCFKFYNLLIYFCPWLLS